MAIELTPFVAKDQKQHNLEKQETNMESSRFTHSRGYPIKYLASSKAIEAPKVMLAPKYKDAVGEEANFGVVAKIDHIQLAFLVQDNNRNDHYQGASKSICIFHETLQQFFEYLHVFHVLSTLHNHIMHQLLIRKGSYFAKPVNGFV